MSKRLIADPAQITQKNLLWFAKQNDHIATKIKDDSGLTYIMLTVNAAVLRACAKKIRALKK